MDLNSSLGIHAQALEIRSKRAEILASNLANADTPGFKARDIDFKEIMTQVHGQGPEHMAVTNPKHFGHIDDMMDASLKYRVALQHNLDGNTVDTQVESGKFTENNLHYAASLRFLDMKVKNRNTVIKGE